MRIRLSALRRPVRAPAPKDLAGEEILVGGEAESAVEGAPAAPRWPLVVLPLALVLVLAGLWWAHRSALEAEAALGEQRARIAEQRALAFEVAALAATAASGDAVTGAEIAALRARVDRVLAGVDGALAVRADPPARGWREVREALDRLRADLAADPGPPRRAAAALLDAARAQARRLATAGASATAAPGRHRLAFTGLAFLALLLVATVAWEAVRVRRAHDARARRREEEIRERNRRNQDAILKLLDEIGDLADGDLTTHVTVTEEITGSIADAVNYAIDALRELVTHINRASEAVAASAQTTRRRTSQLSLASEKQTGQLARANAAIQAMAGTEREVSRSATTSSDVAQRSVEAASRGARSVRETISGMEEIRDHIRETSQRLKRLGESSQEIGNIVGIIDDIADQTNVLALNATIQASMAGEAGRGFAVVADEVQRLAERSRQATRRIEALVGTIQADAGEAISSMERSTAGVVRGSELARDAGRSLAEIERVCNELEALVAGICEASQQQAARAAAIAGAMSAIERFSVQVRAGTGVTAKSADRLADLAETLKRLVARFRLPVAAGENVVDLVHDSGPARTGPGDDHDRSRAQA